MACPARSGFPARTNSRLDAFLRKHLPPEVYDAIRAYESCIVVSDTERHSLKYVVLSDRLIYLTENPPKSIRRVAALQDIVAIDLSSDLFYFLVNKLHEYLPESKDKNALQNKSERAGELVGTLFNLLVILISEPQIPKSCPVFDIQLVADSTLVEKSFDAEGNLGLGTTKLAISWMMSFLQSCPPIITFVATVVKQMVKGLSASFRLLSPSQAVLLYQQFYILKSCLQYSKTLAEHIRNDYREEFRYFIHMPALEKKLPLCYPITQPTTQLFHEVLKLVEQKQYVKH
ncbi:hypothetical protein MUG91_G240n10 [Manis pentadactyla]|nr:hypothetical protein MUG91_G240n10 [Manis pentadactyla]